MIDEVRRVFESAVVLLRRGVCWNSGKVESDNGEIICSTGGYLG